MKRQLIAMIAVALIAPIHSFAQSFRITDVQVTNADYNKMAGQTLGKTLILQVFDNSITIDIDGKQHLALKHNAGGYYSTAINNKPYDIQYFEAFLHTDWKGTVTALKLNYIFEQQQPPYKQYTVNIVAK